MLHQIVAFKWPSAATAQLIVSTRCRVENVIAGPGILSCTFGGQQAQTATFKESGGSQLANVWSAVELREG